MEKESYGHGVPSWVDVASPDPAAAAAFYHGLFGWDVVHGPPEAGGYAIAQLRGKSVAGIGPLPAENVPPVWTTYINVDDADAVAQKVSSNGGMVFMPPFDVLDVGRMAIFADPTGAVFGVWQPKLHKGAELVNEPNTWCWNELLTTDVGKAKAFYGAVFGWGSVTHEGAMPYTEWQIGGNTLGGMMPKPPMMPAEVPPHWLTYFAVTDTDATVKKVVELGGSLVAPPMDIEPGRFAVVADPAGATFGVIAMKS
jgi:uncharacterized protein